MRAAIHLCLRVTLSCLGTLLASGLALADGGTIQAMQEGEDFIVTVFTSPTVLTAGEVDFSVLVQDANSRVVLPAAKVDITVTPRLAPYLAERRAATEQLATNRLLKVAHVELAEGWHDLAVVVSEGGRRAHVPCAVQVGAARTKAASFWPWFTWPAVPLVLVGAARIYRRVCAR